MISQNTLADLKGPKGKHNLHLDDVRGDFLGPPHGTTSAVVLANKITLRSFIKSSEHINEKGDGPHRGFGYISSCSDPVDWRDGANRNYCNFATFNRIVDTKTTIIQMGTNILNVD